MAATTSSCSSSSLARPCPQPAGLVESADVLGQQGIVADAARDHGVGQPEHHHPVEAQAPGPGERGDEHAVAESAVGKIRGVERASLRAGCARPARTRRGRRAPTPRRARRAPAPNPAPARPRRARRGARTDCRCRGSGRGAPRPTWRGSTTTHPEVWPGSRGPRRTRPGLRPSRPPRRAVRRGSRSRSAHWTGPRTTPASDDMASHRLAGTRPRPGPDTTGAVESHAMTSWRAQSEAGSSSSPSNVVPATVRSRCRVPGPLTATPAAASSWCKART